MDKELLYNASGAKDETAYKAIINVMKGSKEMSATGVNKGEVWEVVNGESARLVVTLNTFEGYAATVMLQSYEPQENSVAIRVRDIMYADAGRLGWVFYDKFVEYVRTLTEDEERELRQAIAKALEVGVICEPVQEDTEELTLRLEAARAEADVLRRHEEAARKEIGILRQEVEEAKAAAAREEVRIVEGECYALREDLAAARKEAEIYKGLYEAMLQRALG